jgi:hypothetical protein
MIMSGSGWKSLANEMKISEYRKFAEHCRRQACSADPALRAELLVTAALFDDIADRTAAKRASKGQKQSRSFRFPLSRNGIDVASSCVNRRH